MAGGQLPASLTKFNAKVSGGAPSERSVMQDVLDKIDAIIDALQPGGGAGGGDELTSSAMIGLNVNGQPGVYNGPGSFTLLSNTDSSNSSPSDL